jgi:hypothetical protein
MDLQPAKMGRNTLRPCGRDAKYKKCCCSPDADPTYDDDSIKKTERGFFYKSLCSSIPLKSYVIRKPGRWIEKCRKLFWMMQINC